MANRKVDRLVDRQSGKLAVRKTGPKQAGRNSDRQTGRQDRQIGWPTGKQIGRQMIVMRHSSMQSCRLKLEILDSQMLSK